MRLGALGPGCAALGFALSVGSAAAGAAGSGYTETEAGPGRIQGQVRLDGPPPEARLFPVNKDAEVCGQEPRSLGGARVGSGGELVDVVVWIDKIRQGRPWVDPDGGYVLDQQGCAFKPHTRVVRREAALVVHNKDPIFHDIHAWELIGRARTTLFQRGQEPEETIERTLTLKRPDSHVIKLECDAHEFMHEYLFVADSPYFSVTGQDGRFAIEGVPAGTWTLRTWHPGLGEQTVDVVISGDGGGSADVRQDFVLRRL